MCALVEGGLAGPPLQDNSRLFATIYYYRLPLTVQGLAKGPNPGGLEALPHLTPIG